VPSHDLPCAYAWPGSGTHDDLLEAGEFVRVPQHRQGLQVACLEAIAYLQGFVGREQLRARGKLFTKTKYGRNLLRLGHEGRQPS
jgi:glucose-1-phosphate thymidylyltransferase